MAAVSARRRRVYFNEFNVLMQNSAYLPLVSGLLRAYAETDPTLREHYEFAPFLFYRDRWEAIVERYDNPAVAAFSVSMWNEQISLRVAAEVKQRYPDCLIVFGGANVPHHPADYFAKHRFVDVAVRGEGEEAFAEILRRALTSRRFDGIAGIAWRDPETGVCIRSDLERPQSRDLDVYPSPYLEGLFEPLMADYPDLTFQAIVETNRGCPFTCTFCFWGQGGLSRKYRFHGLDRVAAELEWCAQHEIRYVFNADSNFGMHRRDADIARTLVDLKQRYGFPEKFRTCFGKNTDDKIFEIASMLHAHDLEKGITLARQSNDDVVLENIRRQNIKMATYRNLQVRFNETNVPVYSELILGLPGETMQSWVEGIEDLLRSGLKNQLFIYLCQVLTNTELADPEYMARFGIVTRRIQLTEIHAAVREDTLLPEYEDVIVQTNAMPLADWRRMALFSWTTMVLHSLKLGYFLLIYLAERYGVAYTDFIRYISEREMPDGVGTILRGEIAHFDDTLDRLLEGEGRGHVMPEFGGIYWDEEEASFLRISNQLDAFYDEMLTVARSFLADRGIVYDEAELREAVEYQRWRIPSWYRPTLDELHFEHNFPEFFETHFTTRACALERKAQVATAVNPRRFDGDRPRFAKETILWGRKSGTMLVQSAWRPAAVALA